MKGTCKARTIKSTRTKKKKTIYISQETSTSTPPLSSMVRTLLTQKGFSTCFLHSSRRIQFSSRMDPEIATECMFQRIRFLQLSTLIKIFSMVMRKPSFQRTQTGSIQKRPSILNQFPSAHWPNNSRFLNLYTKRGKVWTWAKIRGIISTWTVRNHKMEAFTFKRSHFNPKSNKSY